MRLRDASARDDVGGCGPTLGGSARSTGPCARAGSSSPGQGAPGARMPTGPRVDQKAPRAGEHEMNWLFDLHDLPGPHPGCPDPVHNDRDLWLGLDVAERFLGFSLEEITLIFRHSRPAAIGVLCAIGAQLDDRTLGNQNPGSHWAQLSPGANGEYRSAMVGSLRGLLSEAQLSSPTCRRISFRRCSSCWTWGRLQSTSAVVITGARFTGSRLRLSQHA